ncbi:hypothetical protein MGG_15208 [Pyricularia oryzae 70-15]|uniref:Uncharacterized protein n=1 Tax=Pyricularia oryzae (strain 70-15 / ATCC MYA-4617 / FGSC 8958) TaxID=242507 RepID=G4N243_PYRO7|nr:uncharacterized protein MGG_15208 [Pyricularia oryzae 70-15]EHA51659.1 hypothetical protein MGG_15208 [Pyricularia oryzae 70-15]
MAINLEEGEGAELLGQVRKCGGIAPEDKVGAIEISSETFKRSENTLSTTTTHNAKVQAGELPDPPLHHCRTASNLLHHVQSP